jgi:hypothetical protein
VSRVVYNLRSMFSPQLVLYRLFRQVEQRRPYVVAALRPHQADLMIVGNVVHPDTVRIAALIRAGATTIGWALAEPWPTGSSVPEQRLLADLQLLHQAWALANDLERPEWYRELARATAHGIGLVIASGLSGEESPGGLDLHLWRACGTRSYAGACDDALCLLCAEHDRARGAIREQEVRQNRKNRWKVAGAVGIPVVVAVLGPRVARGLASAFGRR